MLANSLPLIHNRSGTSVKLVIPSCLVDKHLVKNAQIDCNSVSNKFKCYLSYSVQTEF